MFVRSIKFVLHFYKCDQQGVFDNLSAPAKNYITCKH